ncbi:MAG: SRPBCC family protein [Planctomycetes bacterium]|nr:SRPBCC family protein [Planctomycetota bacterium]
MARIELSTEIQAPLERCFDLARDLDLHKRALRASHEEAIAGRTSGLIEKGETVTWRARHFGVWHEHTSEIVGFEPPTFFRDEMIQGRFREFVHDHYFQATETGTHMRDVLVFRSPLGPLGALVDKLVMKAYLQQLLAKRNEQIRREAEAL